MFDNLRSDPMAHPMLEQLLNLRKKGEGEIVCWKGSKFPRGIKLGSITLETAQHGILRDITGQDVGTYERVIEFGGSNKDEHEIIAWVSK